jgi:quinol monooxygenase YgiN
MLLIAGFVRFDPRQRDATVASILEQVRETRWEPGCLHYSVAEDVEQSDTLGACSAPGRRGRRSRRTSSPRT